MKKQNFGFTLIELLVVIVIIGILATISTATFSGYFSKARDTERQTFVRDVKQIILAEQVTEDTPDYDLSAGAVAATGTNVLSNLTTILEEQGLDLAGAKNQVDYYYAFSGTGATNTAASDFVIFSCIEDNKGEDVAAGTDPATILFSAGTVNLAADNSTVVGDVKLTNPDVICGDAAYAAPVVVTEAGGTDTPWSEVNLTCTADSSGAAPTPALAGACG